MMSRNFHVDLTMSTFFGHHHTSEVTVQGKNVLYHLPMQQHQPLTFKLLDGHILLNYINVFT